jgi:hypothetical protein|tara:strand:- start:643 stop:888 length:246 start_codon:yes stop_codon:yes gene_type:complete
MKNLYDKLKPEIRNSIQEDLKKYPTSTMSLIDSLKAANFWSDLKVHNVNSIILHDHTNLLTISHMDLLYGDRFLLNEDELC